MAEAEKKGQAPSNNNETAIEKGKRTAQEARDAAAAAKASEAAAKASQSYYNTSAAGLGALASRLNAKKAEATPRSTPTAAPTPTATSLSITTPHDLGGTPISPYATPTATKKSE